MADLQIPTLGQPPAPSFQPPSDVINAYLNRPTPYEAGNQQIGQAMQTFREYQQQNINRQLESLKAIAELYGQGGPGAVQQYAGTINQVAGKPIIDTSQATAQANAPISPSASNGGGPGVPTFAAQTPQAAQTLSPSNPMPMGQGGTGGDGQQPSGGVSPQGDNFPPSAQPSEHILNSVQAGAPDFTGHVQRIQDLQNKMARFANQGKYGQTQTQQIAQQIQAEKATMEAQQAPLQYAKNAQELANAQQQIPMEKAKAMAGETAKIAPSLTEAGTIQDDINALRPLFKGYNPIPFLGQSGAALAARSGSSTFGTPTMQTGKAIEQITPALSAKVNYLLNRRFNSGEAAMLQAKVVPNANDDEANFNQKANNLSRLVNVMQGGDVQALRMVASSLAGQPVNPIIPSSGTSQPTNQGSQSGPYGATTIRNHKTYVWVPSTGKYHLKQ